MTHRVPTYYPAIGGALFNYMREPIPQFKEKYPLIKKGIHLFDQTTDPFYHYPNLLVSAGHFLKFKNVRELIRIPQEPTAQLFLDSGGYQLGTGVATEDKLNEKTVLEWCEANGDVFPILDRPSLAGSDIKETRAKTMAAAKYYYEHRSASGKRILNVLSGGSLGMMKDAYADLSQYKFEGWAHGGHNHRMKAILKGLFFLWEKGEYDRPETTYHHVFGVTRPEAMIYLSYAQRFFNEKGVDIQITYDSSSFGRSMAFGLMFMFPTITTMPMITFSDRQDFSRMPDDYKMPCSCPVCSTVTVQEFLSDTTTYYTLGTLHNLWLQTDYKFKIDQFIHMNCDKIFLSALKSDMTHNIGVMKQMWDNPKKANSLIDHSFRSLDEIHTTEKNGLDGFFDDD